MLSGTSTALESLESSFHQDLNGDGHIGVVTTVIESNGSTNLTEVGNHFYLYDSTGRRSLAEIQRRGLCGRVSLAAAVVPIGAEKTASGYEVAWKVMGTDLYSVWTTDNNGNYISNIIGNAVGHQHGVGIASRAASIRISMATGKSVLSRR